MAQIVPCFGLKIMGTWAIQYMTVTVKGVGESEI